ncbi:hypothetical protein LTR56_002999 [Elasticomyces elasticus]|nr:hypothetical protein LTR56_002999 [Elasticomyces elasticus]KAK3662062.1 hypothetical protein LTR22_007034 [Elasticomyces elasticus]KAK4927576.1 hypothetical protein LTR49_005717 [Elasticomyces elasticus]KAK5753211.1 hypothetical protein LTS12_016678 [Elasticomyces elasticus]
MHYLLNLSLLALSALAAPLDRRAVKPSVTIANGTVVGSNIGVVDSFRGIPYAQPPVGDLRLRAPQSRNTSFGTISDNPLPRACPQFYTSINSGNLPEDAISVLSNTPLAQAVTDAGEDCLTINVQRPSTASATSKLPVVFWIYGGAFEFGSTQTYDGTTFVSKSIQLGAPVIYVAVNYRLGGFGFLAGSSLAKEGSTNFGLRDQRLGLQWVQENIAAFGGESAGSISAFDQTVINDGDNTYKGKALFRGVIMDSGSITPANNVTTSKAQTVYDTVVASAGCRSSADTLACLRKVDYTTFLNAANSVPATFGYRSVDLSYVPRPDAGDKFFSRSPDLSVASGAFAKVPIIIGDQQDEGTLFSLAQSNITTNAQLIQYLASYFPTNPNAVADITGLAATYPDQPLLGQPAGSPFNTGSLNNIYPQYKRLAAILGDITFTLARRSYLNLVASQVPAWSYLSTYFAGTPVLGTFHATDIVVDYITPGIPQTSVLTYYVSFVNKLDPNASTTAAPLITWPKWTSSSPTLVNFAALGNSLIPDNFRQASSDYLATKSNAFRT